MTRDAGVQDLRQAKQETGKNSLSPSRVVQIMKNGHRLISEGRKRGSGMERREIPSAASIPARAVRLPSITVIRALEAKETGTKTKSRTVCGIGFLT